MERDLTRKGFLKDRIFKPAGGGGGGGGFAGGGGGGGYSQQARTQHLLFTLKVSGIPDIPPPPPKKNIYINSC